MRPARCDTLWRLLPRRCGAGITLVSYLLTALHVPLPLPAAPRVAGGPAFPCQDHACGCQSAEQCWAGCCCLTPDERWAWARAHQVEPPSYAERPASASWSTTRLRDREQPPASKPCCQQAPTKSTCCSSHAQTQTSSETKAQAGKGTVRWTSTIAGLKCRGHSTLWTTTGAAVPAVAPLTWQPWFAPIGCLAWSNEFSDASRFPPASPPPRQPHA